ncbi:uncharacterized protein [Dysidea avara]|uniref:uncharacterized protein isoform X2 n=1 Tax=Dysidea avara TaxID=196820 RepID=UPI00331EF66F
MLKQCINLVFMHQPRDVEIFEGNDDTVTFMCNASSNGSHPVYYRWYHRPTNGTYEPLENVETNKLLITKPVMADSGYYLCQAYNHEGSIQSIPAELVVLGTSTIQSRILASFSVVWFTMDEGNTEGSGGERVNITDYSTIESTLETVLNSSVIRVMVVDVNTSVVGSGIKAEIFGICSSCNLVNDSLDTVEDQIMTWQAELYSLVEYIQQDITNREFIVAAPSEGAFVRMRITAANSSGVLIECPPAMAVSNSSFFICVNCAPGSYLSSSTCTPCEFDHFQDQQGQTSCKPCPTGSRTNDIGTRTPEECMLKASATTSSSKSNGAAAIAATVTILVVFAILVVGISMIYLLWRRRHKKYKLPAVHAPTIILENSTVLPASFPTDDAEDNVSEIPTIRYVKPPEADVELAPRRNSSKNLRKKQKSEEIVRFPKEIELRQRSSSTHVKRKYSSGSRIPSCYPIGEYTGPLSDQEGDMYDKIASPSNSGRRRSMSVSDLSSLAMLSEKDDTQLHVPSLLSRLHAKREPHYQPTKPLSAPIEMDEDMSDLYDSTLKSPRSKSYNAAQSPSIRLSGLNISFGQESAGSRRAHNSRPVTKYENSEVIKIFRESFNSEEPEQVSTTQPPLVDEQPSTVRLDVPQLKKEEESPYVTMKSVASRKQSLPDLKSYFNWKSSKTKQSNSFPEGPIDDIPPIELNTLSTQAAKTNSLHDKSTDDSVPIEMNGLDAQVPPVSVAIQPVSDSEA